ncbi:MAG: hypothetical protein GWN01_05980 [Nitrosopumilaceae archaeon]|nr:hypothetical protein [Nitrosopumilaceae archaeon]NIU00487.1 hypothetical protein [Nitrosopumilaceae archaeon]NIU86870.1 hypothetical protein [Nitrosopumilaceae archaeon]NIX61089.1 hypothetical protein [Nitrosopumilaceae archaeon]
MKIISDNPYYPVSIDDYSKLFDFAITDNGIIYLERLNKKLSSGIKLGDDESLYYCMLALASASSQNDIESIHKIHEFMFSISDKVDPFKPRIKSTLIQMGCIKENPHHNPKLYKSHLLWKNENLKEMENYSQDFTANDVS